MIATCDARKLFCGKCFVAWRGSAAVSNSHQTVFKGVFMGMCDSFGIWNYTRFIIHWIRALSTFFPLCKHSLPANIFTATAEGCACQDMWHVRWSHRVVDVPHPLRVTFSLLSVARMKAEHQSKMSSGSVLLSWTSSSTGDQTIGPGASPVHIAWTRCVVSSGVFDTTPQAMERLERGIFNRLRSVFRTKKSRSTSWVNLPGESALHAKRSILSWYINEIHLPA